MKSKDDILLEQAYADILEEAKKKVNPWAVCNASTGGKKKNPEKFEKCVKGVKEKSGYKEEEDKGKHKKDDKKKVVKENTVAPTNPTQAPTNTANTQVEQPDELDTLLQSVKDPDIKKALEGIAKQRQIAKVEQAASAPTVQKNPQYQPQM
jgi:hypothetical protein